MDAIGVVTVVAIYNVVQHRRHVKREHPIGKAGYDPAYRWARRERRHHNRKH